MPLRECSEGVGDMVDLLGLALGGPDGTDDFRVMIGFIELGNDCLEFERDCVDGGREKVNEAFLVGDVGKACFDEDETVRSRSEGRGGGTLDTAGISSNTSEVVGVGTGDLKVTFFTAPTSAALIVLTRIVSSPSTPISSSSSSGMPATDSGRIESEEAEDDCECSAAMGVIERSMDSDPL